MSQNKFAMAHEDFDHALNLDDSNPKMYHGKGLGFQSEGEHYALTAGQDRDLNEE